MAARSSKINDFLQSILLSPKTKTEIIQEFEKAGKPLDDLEKALSDGIRLKVIQQKTLNCFGDANQLYMMNPLQLPLLETPVTKSIVPNDDLQTMKKEVENLKSKLTEINEEIALLASSYSEEELQLHIQKLHEYNEIKDTGQILLGKIAEFEGVTTSSLYERFDLSLDD